MVGNAHPTEEPMSDYRRWYVPGGTYFFTIVTYHRRRLFDDEANVERLRAAVATVLKEQPFEIVAAVILPDHLHFLWTLPPGDDDYSKRIGRMKVEFTKSLNGISMPRMATSESRQKHRESDVWQRRAWEHVVRDEHDFDRHFDYIHYNPVKHGYVSCPHLWPYSSFRKWVDRGVYDQRWACQCEGRSPLPLDFTDIADTVGE